MKTAFGGPILPLSDKNKGAGFIGGNNDFQLLVIPLRADTGRVEGTIWTR